MLCGRTVSRIKSLLGKQQRLQHEHQHQNQQLPKQEPVPVPMPMPSKAESPLPASHVGGGPISYKLRSLKFQPKCRPDGATKLHDFINNDLSQFLMENRVESGGELPVVPRICLTDLPFEILLRILSYLDLKSLFRVGQVSRIFYDISSHPLLYAELSLKPYWHLASSTLLCTLALRATMLRKLDLSWCGGLGNISPTEFKK